MTADQLEEDQLWRQRIAEVDSPLDLAVGALEAELLTRDQLADLPMADALIPGVLNRVTYAALTGRDATYKTLLALSWGCCLATGTPWHKRPVDPVRVLYLIGEGAYDFDNRISAWEQASGVAVPRDRFVTLPRVPNMFKASEMPALLELIRRGGYGLVVVDTLRRAATGADMNGSDMARVIDNLEAIKRATGDGAVLVLVHTDKGDNDSRGFSGIEDDADTVWHAKREKNTAPVDVVNEKMRNAPDGASFKLTPRAVGPSIVLDMLAEYGHDHRPAEQRLSPTARKVLDVLRLPGYENGATARGSGDHRERVEAADQRRHDRADGIRTSHPNRHSRAVRVRTLSAGVRTVNPPTTCTDTAVLICPDVVRVDRVRCPVVRSPLKDRTRRTRSETGQLEGPDSAAHQGDDDAMPRRNRPPKRRARARAATPPSDRPSHPVELAIALVRAGRAPAEILEDIPHGLLVDLRMAAGERV